jgi:RNA polymerase sigma-70 factor (ECF subfamily)
VEEADATPVAHTLSISDRDLVDQVRYGDLEAFDELYRRFSDMVFNLALRMAGERDVAEDLTQEIFLRVYRHLAGFQGRSSVRTWVYRVAVNACRSGLARQGRRAAFVQTVDAELLARVPTGEAGPESVAAHAERRRRLETALATLPLTFRSAVVLRDIEGLSYDEIAEILGVRLGTVRSRIARGRSRLRGLLEEGEA